MKFKLQQEKIDFGSTQIENIFINDFMPTAKGNYVKIYLLAYKYAKDGENTFSNETLSKNLGLSLAEVDEAWKFWQEQGIVKLINYNDNNYEIEFINLKQLYVENIYKYVPDTLNETEKNEKYHEDRFTFDDLVDANKSEMIRSMFREIELLLGRLITINEKRTILEWISKYSATPEIVTETFKYTVEKKKIKNIRYVESLLAAWHDKDIHDTESLHNYLEDSKKNINYYNAVKTNLGFSGRQLTLNEKKLIDKWVDDWGFSMDMILEALSFSSKTSNPNLNYFNSILENWSKTGIKKPDEIKLRKKTQSFSKSNSSNSFHNFEQQYDKMTEKELEKLANRNYDNLTKNKEDI